MYTLHHLLSYSKKKLTVKSFKLCSLFGSSAERSVRREAPVVKRGRRVNICHRLIFGCFIRVRLKETSWRSQIINIFIEFNSHHFKFVLILIAAGFGTGQIFTLYSRLIKNSYFPGLSRKLILILLQCYIGVFSKVKTMIKSEM